MLAGQDDENAGAEAQQPARIAPSDPLREIGEGEPPEEAYHGEQDHHLGGFLRRYLEQQDEQRGRPQDHAVDAGLGAGIAEPGDQHAARRLEELEPRGLGRQRRAGRGRQGECRGFDLQRPGERRAGFLVAALADQPPRRFRHPEANEQHQRRRQHADGEE